MDQIFHPADGKQYTAMHFQESEAVNRFLADTQWVTPQTFVTSVGQIAHMNIPDNWQVSKRTSPDNGFQEFDNSLNDAKLCFFYRGTRLNASDAAAFRSCLMQPPHEISGAELSGLTAVLRDRVSPDFTVWSAETVDLNGKRVMQVDGQYNLNKEKTRALFIDADGTGSAVQEVYYQAKPCDYLRFLLDAQRSFNSIEWKGDTGTKKV